MQAMFGTGLVFVFIVYSLQNCDAFENSNYSYENSSIHNNASFVSVNQTEPLLLNILVVSNDSTMRQDNYSLMLNNTIDTLAGNKLEFQLYNSTKYFKSSNFAEQFSEAISTKLAGLFREWMKSFLSLKISVHKNRYNGKSESTSINILSSGPNSMDLETDEHLQDTTAITTTLNPEDETKKTPVEGRQFLFHPYIPYDKEIKPDEKISIHDVLPVKIVKFVKSMVEDAPWEQMFMKMVRMVVDQFVDKIIEQMFAHKDDEGDKWRSFDGDEKSPWLLLKHKMTSLIRSRRSSDKNRSEKENDLAGSSNPPLNHISEKDVSWADNSFASMNRISKGDSHKMREEPEPTWLDSVLDYLFSEEKEKSKPESYDFVERQKRNVDNHLPTKNPRMEDILKVFLKKYLQLSVDREQLNVERNSIPIELSGEGSIHVVADGNLTKQPELENPKETSRYTSGILSPLWSDLLKKNARFNLATHLRRRKRSTDLEEYKESKRLWQATLKSRSPSHKTARDECSLRRACNAGRLLARLPSVPDLTLQLREYGSEPHWDALLWGMAKKRCSKIFCKRQRSPKGSKYYWNNPEKRFYRKHSSTARLRSSKSDLTTIFPV